MSIRTSCCPLRLIRGAQYKKGDTINADNVTTCVTCSTPYSILVSEMGRELNVVAPTQDLYRLSPWEYIEATLRHQGQAVADDGNVVTLEGEPWIGGNPFPDPRSASEVFAGATLSWGRHDVSFYAVKEYDLDPDGKVSYEYQSCWVEMNATGRVVLEPRPYMKGHKDKLRFQSVFFLTPSDSRGTSYLNIWPYDQNRYPELYGYLPAFKRVSDFPQSTIRPDSRLNHLPLRCMGRGDPFLTWGNYRFVKRGPMLAAINSGWQAGDENWGHRPWRCTRQTGYRGGAHTRSWWSSRTTGYPGRPSGKASGL